MTTTPPATAVAADAPWAATRARLANRSRPTATLTICDDPGLKQALADAEYHAKRTAAEADEQADDKVAKARAATAKRDLVKAQQAFEDAAIRLRFQALPRPDFEALKEAHPPTAKQAEDGAAFDSETLAPALIAASSLDGMTEDDAREYLATWGEGEAVALWATAWNIQSHTRLDTELGKG
ncbi:hypothetical protein [Streptomyces koyangensis]|uniref:hypothetical protein n=1 Tax=Streptomyces koyangensis TaxID=188770 RepID=UPI003BF54196